MNNYTHMSSSIDLQVKTTPIYVHEKTTDIFIGSWIGLFSY